MLLIENRGDLVLTTRRSLAQRITWLSLVDLFRNYVVEFDFSLSQLKSLFEVLNASELSRNV